MQNNLQNENKVLLPFGDPFSSLPTDEQYEQHPQDLPLLRSIFVPVPEPEISYHLKLATFAGVIYTLLIKTPFIEDYFKKNVESSSTRHIIQLGIVAGATYLFSKTL